jgi:signal peptidase I
VSWLPGAGILCGAAVATLAEWARTRLVLVTVHGSSMAPAYRDGDRVVALRRTVEQLRRGDVAVLRPPVPGGRKGTVDGALWNLKRIAALPGDRVPAEALRATRYTPHVPSDALIVLGDNEVVSADSRRHGFYPAAGLLGVVKLRLGRAESE